MNQRTLSRLMYAYGIVLVSGGISAISIIGPKAKNLAILSITIGALCLLIGNLLTKRNDKWLLWCTQLIPLTAFVLFIIRTNLNFLTLIGIVQHELDNYDAYNKCINVVILLVLAMTSLFVWILAFTYETKKEN